MASRLSKSDGARTGCADAPLAAARQPLASFGVDGEVAFANAKDRAAFVAELSDCVEGMVAKYHAGATAGARTHRVILALYPAITKDGPTNNETPSGR